MIAVAGHGAVVCALYVESYAECLVVLVGVGRMLLLLRFSVYLMQHALEVSVNDERKTFFSAVVAETQPLVVLRR